MSSQPNPKEQTTSSLRRRGTVLIIEDDDMVAEVTRMGLQVNQYKVYSANCGERALSLFQRHVSEIGLVIIDYLLPDLESEHIVGQLRNMKPGIKVIGISGFLTAFSDTSNPSQCVDARFLKPFSIKELSAKVAELLPEPAA